MRLLAGSLLIALSPLAAAQAAGDPIDTQVTKLDTTAANRGQTLVASKIASNFSNFAGSKENSLALVNALRNGTNTTLTYTTAATTPGGTPTTTTATYDPPTGKMGWGNVKISLALAQDSLARAGITNPTAEQLQAALNGGSITAKNPDGTTTTTKLDGVLKMRADGMGWGQIAKANGTKVGPVVSDLKMAHSKVAALPPTTGTSTTTTAAGTGTGASKGKGITTGDGGSTAQASKGKGSGITTAAGGSATQTSKGHGNATGKGIVTGAGGGATNVAAAGGGKPSTAGAGVVTGAGNGGPGVSTAQGGKGNGNGNGNGKGKGG